MKNRQVGYIILFALFYLLIQACTVFAYELTWSSIQHRVYEAQEDKNRLQFEIRDDYGNQVNSKSVVTGVVIEYPDGTTVTLGDLGFEYYQITEARFYPDSSQWVHNSPRMIGGFFADIESSLVIGTYTLRVSMENGQILTALINFNFLLDLPVISSRSFQIHMDSTGNVHWAWRIPEELLSLAKIYDIQARAGVAAMFEGEMVALYWPNLPIEVGYSIVPSSTYLNLVNQADELQFIFQVRTSDSNARAYSKIVEISNPSSTVSIVPRQTIGDATGDGIVSLDDPILSLQVLTGVR